MAVRFGLGCRPQAQPYEVESFYNARACGCLKSHRSSMRLNRYIARSGASSRREADLLIKSGRISVNGKPCLDLSTTVEPGKDSVRLDGNPLNLPSLLYLKFYKPRGVVTTLDDPQKRKSVAHFLRDNDIPDGVVPAGRLDRDSEGLLILTNDGDLLQKLTHPSHEVTKTYRVLVDRRPDETDLQLLIKGIRVKEYTVRALKIARMGPQPPDEENPTAGYWIEMIMGEGRKREIREMLAAMKYHVLRLVRIAHGPITSHLLTPGEIAPIENTELQTLLDSVTADPDT